MLHNMLVEWSINRPDFEKWNLNLLQFSVNTNHHSMELGVRGSGIRSAFNVFLIWGKDFSSLNLSFLLNNKKAEFKDL